VNVSFAYEAFDDPALSEMQLRGATYESESLISFVVSSIKITSANVAFGSKHVPSTFITITNYPDSDSAAVVAKLPLFNLAEALGCFPPSTNCVVAPSSVDTLLNASRLGGPPVDFLQRFELRFPNPPIVRARGSLIVDINKQADVAFLVQGYRALASVHVGGVSCPFVVTRTPSVTVVNVSIEKNTLLVSNRSDVVFKSLVDPEYFSANGPSVIFRDFTVYRMYVIVPSFGPIFGGTFVAVSTKEMSSEMFSSCTFQFSEAFSAPCSIVQSLVKSGNADDMQSITKSARWTAESASALRARTSDVESSNILGIAIIRVPVPPASFAGGNANISFSFAEKSAMIPFYAVPPPSTPATILSWSPSSASELGGSTVT
jgi:hypothetical protein